MVTRTSRRLASRRVPLVAVLASLVLFACGGDANTARRIPGGKEVRFHGVTFDLPANWWLQSIANGLVYFAPKGANRDDCEEIYVLGGDPSVRSLDGEAAARSVDRMIGETMDLYRMKTGGPTVARFGALDGRKWEYKAAPHSGCGNITYYFDVHVHAFVGDHACALIALGDPDFLAKHNADLDAILGSLAKTAPAAAGGVSGAGRSDVANELVGPWLASELVGQWLWVSCPSPKVGGDDYWITLQADGRYQSHRLSGSPNPNVAPVRSDHEAGAWSFARDGITFRPDRGDAYTQTIEKVDLRRARP